MGLNDRNQGEPLQIIPIQQKINFVGNTKKLNTEKKKRLHIFSPGVKLLFVISGSVCYKYYMNKIFGTSETIIVCPIVSYEYVNLFPSCIRAECHRRAFSSDLLQIIVRIILNFQVLCEGISLLSGTFGILFKFVKS